jgi:hypothetical protein
MYTPPQKRAEKILEEALFAAHMNYVTKDYQLSKHIHEIQLLLYLTMKKDNYVCIVTFFFLLAFTYLELS